MTSRARLQRHYLFLFGASKRLKSHYNRYIIMIARLRALSLILAATTDSTSDHAFLLPHPIIREFHLSRWHPQNPSCLNKGSRADKELPWEEQWKGVTCIAHPLLHLLRMEFSASFWLL